MNDTSSRAYTAEEVRDMFMNQIATIADYWADETKIKNMSILDRCNGLAFSILNIFDGTQMGLPAFDISLSPHETDKQYCIDNNENYFEPGMIINDTMLHEIWNKYQKE